MKIYGAFQLILGVAAVALSAYLAYGAFFQAQLGRPPFYYWPAAVGALLLSLAAIILLMGGLLFRLRSVASVRTTDNGMHVLTLLSGGEVSAPAVRMVRQFGSGIDVGAFATQRFILFLAAGRLWVCRLSGWKV